jgi:hypothetical protein
MKNLYSSDPADFPNPTNPASPVGVSPFPYFYSKSNPRYVAPSALTFLQQGFRWPYNYQINFGVQQQLSRDLALSINYVGVLNRTLPFIIDENAPVFYDGACEQYDHQLQLPTPVPGTAIWSWYRLPGNASCRTEVPRRRLRDSEWAEPELQRLTDYCGETS